MTVYVNCLLLLTLSGAVVAEDGERMLSTTPLTHAIRTEDFAKAKANITRDLVNQPDQGGHHPLTYAVYTRNQELVEALLKGGADPNIVEFDGNNALCLAAQFRLPEMVKALHRAGAIYPVDEKARLPAAFAIRADAVDSLKTLLQLYPQLNIDAGWPWPMSVWTKYPYNESIGSDEINPLFSRGGLLFSAAAGYDEMVRLLLARGADPRKRASSGYTALHYAALEHRISCETVTALMNAGLDPLGHSHHDGIAPSTPLDLAASIGSMDKVEVLAGSVDAHTHAKGIRRAALLASAHGHREIMVFLYQKLGERPPTLEAFLRQHPDLRTKGKGTDVGIPFPTEDIHRLMPASHPKTGAGGQQPGSLAVIASAPLRNHAALLSQVLSDIHGLTVVERDEIDRVAEETLLRQLSGRVTDGKPPDLGLIPAAQLVLLEDLQVSGHKFIRVSLISVGSRIIDSQILLGDAEPDELWSKSIVSNLLESISRLGERENGAVALSLVPLTPTTSSPESLELCRFANLLLPVKASRQPGAVLLNLRQMDHLEAENAMAGEGSYWSAGWVIEGTVSMGSPHTVSLRLGATQTSQGKRVDVTVESNKADLADAVDRAWVGLSEKLSLEAVPEGPSPDKNGGKADEADLLALHARWFLEAGYPEDSYKLANAALLLGNRNEELLRTMTGASIDRLPMLRKEFSGPFGINPCLIDPSIRYRMTSAIPDYLTLCDAARLYLSKVNKPLLSGLRGSESYNEVISHALSELFFFRHMLADSIVETAFENELRTLDGQIHSLAVEFIAKCEGQTTELESLGHMVFRGSLRFPIMTDPKLRKLILERLVQLTTSEEGNFNGYLMRKLLMWHYDGKHYFNKTDCYIETIEALLRSADLATRHPALVGMLRSISASNTDETVKSLKRMLEDAVQVEGIFRDVTSENYEMERFFAVATPSRLLLPLNDVHMLHGGTAGLILDPGEGFEKTGEFVRVAQWYFKRLEWARMDPRQLLKQLTDQADRLSALPEGERPSRSDIQGFKVLLANINRLTPDIEGLLDQVAPEDADAMGKSTSDDSLELEPFMSLPALPGLSQFARWHQSTLDGDQLWLPVTYFEKPDYLWGDPSGSNEAYEKAHHNSRHNAVHVIDLASRTTRTVRLPDDLPRFNIDEVYKPTWFRGHPTNVKKIVLGSKHAYFLTGRHYGQLFLYAINRQTLEVQRVDFPFPYVIAMSARTMGDRLFVSIGQDWIQYGKGDAVPASLVVAVEGAEIMETLVSNLRKPAKSPLDSPLNWIDMIRVGKDDLTLISNGTAPYGMAEMERGATRRWKSGGWKELTLEERKHAVSETHKEFFHTYIYHRQCTINGKRFHFANDKDVGGVPASLVLTYNEESQREFKADWLDSPGKKQKFRLIPVNARPLVNQDQMNRKMFVVEDKERKRPSQPILISANQVIERAGYDASVSIGWRDQFLVFLSYRQVAMPAIWTVSENDLNKACSADISK